MVNDNHRKYLLVNVLQLVVYLLPMNEQILQTNTPQSQPNKTPIIVGATLTVAALGFLAYQSIGQAPASSQPSVEVKPTETSNTPTMAAAPSESAAKKDNTFTTIGMYTSPAGEEEIGVTLEVNNGIVTDATVEVKATNPFSQKWQTVFQSNFKDLVVGKDIATLKLDAVSGSSLTPKGFNDAVEKIKAQLAT